MTKLDFLKHLLIIIKEFPCVTLVKSHFLQALSVASNLSNYITFQKIYSAAKTGYGEWNL